MALLLEIVTNSKPIDIIIFIIIGYQDENRADWSFDKGSGFKQQIGNCECFKCFQVLHLLVQDDIMR